MEEGGKEGGIRSWEIIRERERGWEEGGGINVDGFLLNLANRWIKDSQLSTLSIKAPFTVSEIT